MLKWLDQWNTEETQTILSGFASYLYYKHDCHLLQAGKLFKESTLLVYDGAINQISYELFNGRKPNINDIVFEYMSLLDYKLI